MAPLSLPDDDTLLSGQADWIDSDVAARLTAHTLECIDTEYPHASGSIDGPEDVTPPSDRHPVFYGCFDWHSAVHSHWSLVRALRLFEDHPDRAQILASIDGRLTDANVAREVAYFDEHETFERPYGWAWLLALAAELHRWSDEPSDEWRDILRPLEERIVTLVRDDLLATDRPFRVGTHGNTAFALGLVLEYARTVGDEALESSVIETARAYYLYDTDAPIGYEPLGWDFLSPTLTEADLMRGVLDPVAFAEWFEAFLPGASDGVLPDPVSVDDGEGGVALHLVGLNVSRAWSLASIADGLPTGTPTAALRESAARHARFGVEEAFTDDYAGSHWLSSFVLRLLTRNETSVATGR